MKKAAFILAASLFVSLFLTSCSKKPVSATPDSDLSSSMDSYLDSTASSDEYSTSYYDTTIATDTIATTTQTKAISNTTTTKRSASVTKAPVAKPSVIPTIKVPSSNNNTTAAPNTKQNDTSDKAGKIVDGKYTASDNSYEIQVPKDWVLSNNSGDIMMQSPDFNTSGSNMVIVISDPIDITDLQWSDFQDEFNSAYNCTTIYKSFAHITIDSRPAIAMSYQITIYDTPIMVYQYMISEASHCYTVAYSTIASSPASLANSFDASAKSFRVLKK